MRAAAVPAMLMLVVGAAAADQAAVLLPTALGARVEIGERSGLVVDSEACADGVRVTVSQALRPFEFSPTLPIQNPSACGDPSALDRPADLELPAELDNMRRQGHALDLVRSIVAFVSARVTLDESDAAAQDAFSVLRRGRGRCSGRANLAVGLLRQMGLPARVVHGLLLDEAGPQWHRWGEAWLGPLGWVGFDPGSSVGAVSVRYVPMAGAAEGASLAGVRVESISEDTFAALPRRGPLRIVPVGGATLRCLAPSGGIAFSALLRSADGTRWARRGEGEITFANLLPGLYVLTVRPPARQGSLWVRLDGLREVRLDLVRTEVERVDQGVIGDGGPVHAPAAGSAELALGGLVRTRALVVERGRATGKGVRVDAGSEKQSGGS